MTDAERFAKLSNAVERFLKSTAFVPPWASAGDVWAYHIKDLQRTWLDVKEAE